MIYLNLPRGLFRQLNLCVNQVYKLHSGEQALYKLQLHTSVDAAQ